MNEDQEQEIQEEVDAISFVEFLETIPPSNLCEIEIITEWRGIHRGSSYDHYLICPEIQLHCPEDECNGVRFFRAIGSPNIAVSDEGYGFSYVSYLCSNCRKGKRTYSLAVQRDKDGDSGRAYKFGEMPLYGPPVPSKLISLIGGDREMFLRGRRCENQGLGVGAFVYYRRVVESQKNRILGEIIKVSRKLSIPDEKIATLEAAKAETQFSKAIRSVREAIPESLLINGHNPLTLLHSALSDGLHERNDTHCLELASSIRVILGELSERLSQALKDEAEINNAISKLLTKDKSTADDDTSSPSASEADTRK